MFRSEICDQLNKHGKISLEQTLVTHWNKIFPTLTQHDSSSFANLTSLDMVYLILQIHILFV